MSDLDQGAFLPLPYKIGSQNTPYKLGFSKNKKHLLTLDFSLFTRVSYESQSFYTIESIIEIKQILQMNGSKVCTE